MNLLADLEASKIIAILRNFSLKEVLAAVKPLYKAGISFIEIPFSSGEAENTAPSIIYQLRSHYPSLHVGAGTVLSPEQVREASNAGAEYILSPNISLPVIHETKQKGLFSIPGAMTPSEIVACAQEGADIIKVFPAGQLGPQYIKALKGPLPSIRLAAVGGIHLNNIQDFFKNGIFCVGIGANMTDRQALQAGDDQAVEALARQYCIKIKEYSQKG